MKKDPYPLTKNHLLVINPYNSAAIDRAIWHIVHNHIQDMKADETLVIILGEEHQSPSHIMAQAGLLTNLAKWRDEAPDDPGRRFLFAIERPYDALEARMRRASWIRTPAATRGHLHEYDPDGRAGLNDILADNNYLEAPLSRARVFQTALRHDIKTCFNDAATNQKGKELYLAGRDPLARKIARDEYGIDLTKRRIDSREPKGISIRNSTMVTRALAKAAEDNIRIIVQQTGLMHLYGDLDNDDPYDRSLTARFNREANVRTLGVYFDTRDEDEKAAYIIDEQAFRENPDHIILSNVTERRLNASQPKQERAVLKRLARSHRPGQCPYAKDDLLPQKKQVREMVEKVIAKARASCKP